MQIEEHPKQSFSQAPLQSNTIESKMEKKVAMPAKLPAHSRAAAAQRLNDVPEKPAPGVYYRAPHLVLPSSWRVKRHLKRKSLRQSSKRYAIVERIGTKWTLLPLAFSFINAIVVLASVFVAVSSLVNAT
ncbi:MAG: hypothetical protein JO183_00730, partial [Ktedonobacteraceae bacterium]|nr:hypothetical protein [Ktedonobacteraceae bacterium]